MLGGAYQPYRCNRPGGRKPAGRMPDPEFARPAEDRQYSEDRTSTMRRSQDPDTDYGQKTTAAWPIPPGWSNQARDGSAGPYPGRSRTAERQWTWHRDDQAKQGTRSRRSPWGSELRPDGICQARRRPESVPVAAPPLEWGT